MASVWGRVSASTAAEASVEQAEQLQHVLKAHAIAANAIHKAQQDLQEALDEQLQAASELAGQVMARQAELQRSTSGTELPGVPSFDVHRKQGGIKDILKSFVVNRHTEKDISPIGMGMRH